MNGFKYDFKEPNGEEEANAMVINILLLAIDSKQIIKSLDVKKLKNL